MGKHGYFRVHKVYMSGCYCFKSLIGLKNLIRASHLVEMTFELQYNALG
jgi:hypothetical protein